MVLTRRLMPGQEADDEPPKSTNISAAIGVDAVI
jgi:hypothetical protein